MSEFPVVFVGGLHRSGTSIMAKLLSSHPIATGLIGIQGPENEGQFAQSVYMTDHQMGTDMGGFRLFRGGTVTRWAYHDRAHLIEGDAVTLSNGRERLMTAWRPFWQNQSAELFVEKSPSNLTRTRFLQELFPECAFVIVRRHPVTQALAARKWGSYVEQSGFSLGKVIEHWVTAMSMFDRDRSMLHQVCVVAFEDLMARPNETMKQVHRFLGITHAVPNLTPVNMTNDRYVKYWSQLRDDVKGKAFVPLYGRADWKDRLRRFAERATVPRLGLGVARRIEHSFGDTARHFGYDIRDASSALPWPGVEVKLS